MPDENDPPEGNDPPSTGGQGGKSVDRLLSGSQEYPNPLLYRESNAWLAKPIRLEGTLEDITNHPST
jgi:hypothetical protein